MDVTIAGLSLSEQNFFPDGTHKEIGSIFINCKLGIEHNVAL